MIPKLIKTPAAVNLFKLLCLDTTIWIKSAKVIQIIIDYNKLILGKIVGKNLLLIYVKIRIKLNLLKLFDIFIYTFVGDNG